jgi:membrane protein DedA with SNARE-associated domain
VVALGVLCWLANTVSAAGMYFFARAHGPAFFREGWGRKLMPAGVMASLEEAYERWGTAGIFVSRFFPGLRAAVTPFAGVAGLGPARALVPAALASAIWYAILAFLGSQVAENWDAVKILVGNTNRALGLGAVILASVAALWLWRRSRRPTV